MKEAKAKRPRGNPNLKKGVRPPHLEGKRTGKPSTTKVPRAANLLREMRAVFTRPATKDVTQGQKIVRRLLEESPREFLRHLARLEEAYGKGAQGQHGGEGGARGRPARGEVDEGTLRLRELMPDEWDRWAEYERWLGRGAESALGAGAEGAAEEPALQDVGAGDGPE